jgi:hypothetical protein
MILELHLIAVRRKRVIHWCDSHTLSCFWFASTFLWCCWLNLGNIASLSLIRVDIIELYLSLLNTPFLFLDISLSLILDSINVKAQINRILIILCLLNINVRCVKADNTLRGKDAAT